MTFFAVPPQVQGGAGVGSALGGALGGLIGGSGNRGARGARIGTQVGSIVGQVGQTALSGFLGGGSKSKPSSSKAAFVASGGCDCGPDAICVGTCNQDLFGRFDCSQCAPKRGGGVQLPGGGGGSFSNPNGGSQGGPSTAVAVPGCNDCVITTATGRQLRGKVDRATGRCVQVRKRNLMNMKANRRALSRAAATMRELKKFEKAFNQEAPKRPARRASAKCGTCRKVRCSCG